MLLDNTELTTVDCRIVCKTGWEIPERNLKIIGKNKWPLRCKNLNNPDSLLSHVYS